MRTYPVIAEMIDRHTGERKFPGETFKPHDEAQEQRLIDAECLSKTPVRATRGKAGA